MARGRFLNKKISRDKRVAELIEMAGIEAGLLFTWLVAHLDREGRHDGDPAVVLGYVAPRVKSITVADVERALSAMNELGLIDWYEVDGDMYLSCPGFEKNQIGMRKNREAESEVPPPPDKLRTNSGVAPDKLRSSSGQTPSTAGLSPREVEVEVEDQVEVQLTITDQPVGCQSSLPVETKPDKKSELSVKIQTVWGAFRQYHPHCAGTLKSSRKEYKLLAARLKDGFTVPQLIQAVKGYHVNPYHCGENDTGTKYQSFELIMRNSVQVENGIRYANGSARTKPKTESNYLKSIEILNEYRERSGDENEGLRQMHGGFAGILPDGSE